MLFHLGINEMCVNFKYTCLYEVLYNEISQYVWLLL